MLTIAIVVGILFVLIVVSSLREAKKRAAFDTEWRKERKREKRRNYPVDLDSEVWKDIKRRVLERDRSKCRFCDKPAVTAHHIDYDERTLRGECLDRLFAVCKACHYKLHFDVDEKERVWTEVVAITLQMVLEPSHAVVVDPDASNVRKKARVLEASQADDVDYDDIERRVLDRDHSICRCCCEFAETVYHLGCDGPVLNGDHIDDFVAVCFACDHKIHFDDDGRQRGWREMHTVSRKMLRDGRRRYDAFD